MKKETTAFPISLDYFVRDIAANRSFGDTRVGFREGLVEEFELEVGESVVVNGHLITLLDVDGEEATFRVENIEAEETVSKQVVPATLIRENPRPR